MNRLLGKGGSDPFGQLLEEISASLQPVRHLCQAVG